MSRALYSFGYYLARAGNQAASLLSKASRRLTNRFFLPPGAELRQLRQSSIWQLKLGGSSIFLSHPHRARLYADGIPRRLEELAQSYGISANLLSAEPVIVDVGANVGELGLWAARTRAVYVAFEPDPSAFEALAANLQGEMFPYAIGEEDQEKEFFLSTKSADSSLLIPHHQKASVTVPVFRLDTLLTEGILPSQIDVLKIEAEGGEPEVLQGATRTLQACRFVAVDAGPERYGENTLPQVITRLYREGFEIDTFNHAKNRILFKRRSTESANFISRCDF